MSWLGITARLADEAGRRPFQDVAAALRLFGALDMIEARGPVEPLALAFLIASLDPAVLFRRAPRGMAPTLGQRLRCALGMEAPPQPPVKAETRGKPREKAPAPKKRRARSKAR